MYSLGSRFTHGTSSRTERQSLSSRHITSGSQAKPPSAITTIQARESLEDALADETDHVRLEDLRQRRVPLDVVGVDPPGHRRRLREDAVGRVRVDADRQAALGCGRVDGEVVPVAHQHVHQRQEDLRRSPADRLRARSRQPRAAGPAERPRARRGSARLPRASARVSQSLYALATTAARSASGRAPRPSMLPQISTARSIP